MQTFGNGRPRKSERLEEYEKALEDGSQFYNIRKEFRETIYMNEDVAVICRRYPREFDDTYNMGYNDYNCCDTYQYSSRGFSKPIE